MAIDSYISALTPDEFNALVERTRGRAEERQSK
jgi:hypothetical protein